MRTQFTHIPHSVVPLDGKWLSELTPTARKHIVSTMRTLEAGRAVTPSFKLYGTTDAIKVIDDFFSLILQKGIVVPKWQLEYEVSRKTKVGAEGGVPAYKDVRDNFLLYYTRPTEVKSNDKDFQLAQEHTEKKYAQLHSRILSITDAYKTLKAQDKILDKAASWPDFNLKKTDLPAIEHAISLARSGKWKQAWAYIFTKFQKKKLRIFFPMAYCLMLLEAQYYNDFLVKIQDNLRLLKDKSPFVFWADKIGFDPMYQDIVTPLYIRAKTEHPGWTPVWLQRDFEKMDTTVGFDQTIKMFVPKLCRALGIKEGSAEWNRLAEILYVGSTCPIATPEGMHLGSRGKASGATTTNGDETADNETYDAVFQLKLARKARAENIEYRIVYSGGNGDDGQTLYILQDESKYDRFVQLISEAANEAAEICGFRVQGDKWFVSKEYGLYCQRMTYINDDDEVINMYPATLIINSIMNPVKEYTPSTWDKDYRDLDIIEKLDNGRHLQYYHELVDYVDNGMKYHLLGRSEKETSRILSKYERYRALREENFNEEGTPWREDIVNSPTLKYLLQKRGLHAIRTPRGITVSSAK